MQGRIGRGHDELLGRQHVMGRVAVQARIGRGHHELLGRQHVMGRVAVQARIGRRHPELLGRQHVVGLVARGKLSCPPSSDDPRSRAARTEASRLPHSATLIISVAPTEITHAAAQPVVSSKLMLRKYLLKVKT